MMQSLSELVNGKLKIEASASFFLFREIYILFYEKLNMKGELIMLWAMIVAVMLITGTLVTLI